jgi:iron uptake system component EfeO
MRRTPATLVAVSAILVTVAGCGSGGSKNAGGGRSQHVDVKLTDAGCDPAVLELRAGPTTFSVVNDGADAVSELEILDGTRILGEAENIAPGLSGEFSLTLAPGHYVSYCPGGTTSERGSIRVTGGGATAAAGSAARRQAVTQYRDYVEGETGSLVRATRQFVAALRTGELARAKSLYARARIPYERIEPVAESFGNLDPAIDARAGDVPAESWTGFHPIEQILWQRGTTAGTGALGDRLVHDVNALQRRVMTVKLEPAQIANGAVELLGEVSKSKITGEEERYSHIDLVDFQANVDGARAAFEAVRPLVERTHRPLSARIAGQFDAVDRALDPYRRGAGGFVAYGELAPADTRALSRAIDALAEPLSRVGAIVVAAR